MTLPRMPSDWMTSHSVCTNRGSNTPDAPCNAFVPAGFVSLGRSTIRALLTNDSGNTKVTRVVVMTTTRKTVTNKHPGDCKQPGPRADGGDRAPPNRLGEAGPLCGRACPPCIDANKQEHVGDRPQQRHYVGDGGITTDRLPDRRQRTGKNAKREGARRPEGSGGGLPPQPERDDQARQAGQQHRCLGEDIGWDFAGEVRVIHSSWKAAPPGYCGLTYTSKTPGAGKSCTILIVRSVYASFRIGARSRVWSSNSSSDCARPRPRQVLQRKLHPSAGRPEIARNNHQLTPIRGQAGRGIQLPRRATRRLPTGRDDQPRL